MDHDVYKHLTCHFLGKQDWESFVFECGEEAVRMFPCSTAFLYKDFFWSWFEGLFVEVELFFWEFKIKINEVTGFLHADFRELGFGTPRLDRPEQFEKLFKERLFFVFMNEF